MQYDKISTSVSVKGDGCGRPCVHAIQSYIPMQRICQKRDWYDEHGEDIYIPEGKG